jgi:hypothetical protein
MSSRPIATMLLACVLFAVCGAAQCLGSPVQPPESPPDFRQLLQKLAEFSPDPCGPPHGKEENWHSTEVESHLFERAANIITQALNATVANPGLPRDHAAEALKKLERMSAEINAAWPEENRFHFQILDLQPALVVKMSIRVHERFVVLAVPEEDAGKPNQSWGQVGSDEDATEHDVPRSEFALYPLHRGPSGNARFLARYIYSGCAGSIGIAYDAREWHPKGMGDLEEIIKQDGSLGPDNKVPEFPQVGKLQTEGSLIALPYCWFSAIDTWDNPSLCAVDTYDLSGDEVRFRSRAFNRPDLVPIAKAIEYAEKRDYPAVLGYCASDDIARTIVRDIQPDFFADDLSVTRTGDIKERVELGDPPAYRFEVEKRAGRWVVVAFSTE